MKEKLRQNTAEIINLNKRCNYYDTNMALMQKDIQDIKSDIGEIKVALKEFMDLKADKWTERFCVGIILIFALSALYYIFNQVGLPTA